jgi:tyrosyl-tRNA synthetase
MFKKVMQLKSDELMPDWFTFFTGVPADRAAVLCDRTRTDPREARVELGKAIVERYHGAAAAEPLRERFFSRSGETVKVIDVGAAPGTWAETLVKHGLASSKSEAWRLIEQGGVTLDDVRVSDPRAPFAAAAGALIRVGKKKFARVGG